MTPGVTIRKLDAVDLIAIERQPSQRLQLGQVVDVSPEEAAALATQPLAFAVEADGRLICCMGIMETFPGKQGVAWAIFAPGIGRAHVAITRHARWQLAHCGLARVEAIVLGADAEPIVTRWPHLDGAQLLAAVLATPTPECRWAAAIGLQPAAVLRKFGGASETHVLFERIG